MDTLTIKKANIATYGFPQYEQTGTIAIDFANYLDKLNSLKGINLKKVLDEGWYQVGFRFTESLIKDSPNLNLDIVLCRKKEENVFEYGFISRTVDKKEFLNLVVHFRIQVSNYVHFKNDDIDWATLPLVEDSSK